MHYSRAIPILRFRPLLEISQTNMLKIGVTTGDPAGIGPEVSLRAACDPAIRGACRLTLFGDTAILQAQAQSLGLPFDFVILSADSFRRGGPLPERGVVQVPAGSEAIAPGIGSRASGDAAARNIVECAAACADGRLDAMVTAPINKKYLQQAGYSYPGHTEFLAHLSGSPQVAMAFLTERLKVVLVTIHLPLREAIDRITADSIFEKLEITLREFPRLGLPCRKVAVAGLNPHAGEDGILGSEEKERIEPAIARARMRYPGVEIHGPLPADTLFYRAVQGEFDVVLALLHDQGLGPIKLMGFGKAVNVTLGLPFIRTSVDHGTAFDIAGKGIANPESMITAIRWSLRLAFPH
jgi:4-hydroxythreonine-4-phosphate dehydrogenase